MAEDVQHETVPEPDPRPATRVLGDAVQKAVSEGKVGRLDLDAVMEKAGGEMAARWRASGARQQAWHAYRRAEEAYWDMVDLEELKITTVASLRLAETTLRKTVLTTEHRDHGWSERLLEELASMCSEYRGQVETDTFADPRAGYMLARARLEEVSPRWPDLDELSVAVDLASRSLDIAGHRLGLDRDTPEA